MNFLEAPSPREALSPEDMQRGLDQRPSLGEYLRANVAEGFWSTGAGQALVGTRLERAATIAFFKVENDGYGLGAQRRAIDQNDLPAVQAELNAAPAGHFQPLTTDAR